MKSWSWSSLALAAVLGLLLAAAPARADTHEPPTGLAPLVRSVLPAVVTVLASGTVQVPLNQGATQVAAATGTAAGQGLVTRRVNSTGSGFIVDPSGVIVTNNHVVAGADVIGVTLGDGTFQVATLLGRDEATDLAVLAISAGRPLPAVQWGDSNKVAVGDEVFAIGDPFGIGRSVTAGIVSATGRDIQEGPFDSFIQTDAAINRGNSGGPLFDMSAHVIGINSAIYTPSGGSVGISFALPSDMARQVITQLRLHGYVERGWLGAGVQTVTSQFAESLGLPAPRGAIIAGIVPGSPAAVAHLHDGDVILGYGGHPVIDARGFARAVAITPLGATEPLSVWRGGHEITRPVTIALPPGGTAIPAPMRPMLPKLKPTIHVGLRFAPLDPATRAAWGLQGDPRGVLVSAVSPDSLAATRGLVAGDVVLAVQQTPVSTPAEVTAEMETVLRAKRVWVLFLVRSRAGLRWVDVPLVRPADGPG